MSDKQDTWSMKDPGVLPASFLSSKRDTGPADLTCSCKPFMLASDFAVIPTDAWGSRTFRGLKRGTGRHGQRRLAFNGTEGPPPFLATFWQTSQDAVVLTCMKQAERLLHGEAHKHTITFSNESTGERDLPSQSITSEI